MPEDSSGNQNPLELAHRVLELGAAVEREVKAANYELAAMLRDKREATENELKRIASPVLMRNLELASCKIRTRSPIIDDLFKPQESNVDESSIKRMASAPLPPRWVIYDCDELSIATLRRQFDTESIDSEYFDARFPVISSRTHARSAKFPAWISAAGIEAERCKAAVVWIYADLLWLSQVGLLDSELARCASILCQFVVCAKTEDAHVAKQFARLEQVTEI